MFNSKFLATSVLAGTLALGIQSQASANATNFVDQAEIGTWSEVQIEALVKNGYLVGYPDGTFKPKQNITREELAVVIYNLVKDMDGFTMEAYNSLSERNATLEEQVKANQKELLNLAAQLDADGTKKFVKQNNFAGLGIVYTINQDSGTNADIELYGKYQAVELSDKLAVSVRGTVDTNTVVTTSVTLDYDVTDRLEVFGGVGAGYLLDQNNSSTIVGDDQDVVPLALTGAQYAISNDNAVYVKGSIPLTVDNGEEATVSGGYVFKF